MKNLWEIIKSITIIKLLITKLTTIKPFIAIRNSYFKCLKGEEKLWKVILFWGVLVYVVLIFFPILYLLLFPLLHYNNPDNLIILLSLEIFLILIIIKFLIKPFIIIIKNFYFKCLKGEEKIWRVILLWGVLPYFIVLIFFPYSEDW